MTNFCSQCGTQMNVATEFCSFCGTRGGGAPSEKKKGKSPILVTCLGCGCTAVVGFVLMIVMVLILVSGSMSTAAKEDYYTIGNDRVASVKLALGEVRTITGLGSSITNGVTKIEYKYQVLGNQQGNEMSKYVTYLVDQDGFSHAGDIDFSTPTGKGQVERPSVDDGYVVVMQFEYDKDGYTIIITRTKGEATPQTPAEETTPQAVHQPADPPLDVITE